jgi:hypothetical protein
MKQNGFGMTMCNSFLGDEGRTFVVAKLGSSTALDKHVTTALKTIQSQPPDFSPNKESKLWFYQELFIMATYNVHITPQARRSFRKELDEHLIDMHIAFDPSVARDKIKSITTSMNDTSCRLKIGNGSGGSSYRYMRIVIDILSGSKGAKEKKQLLERNLQCCIDYEEKWAEETEIEVRVNEIDEANVIRGGSAK